MRSSNWGRAAALPGALVLACVLSACATNTPRDNRIAIETVSKGTPLAGADCTVGNGSVNWTIKSPAVVEIAIGDGDLTVICNKPGYRTSQVTFQSGAGPGYGSGSSVSFGLGGSSGGRHGGGVDMGVGVTQMLGGNRSGDYPARIVVEMTPQIY